MKTYEIVILSILALLFLVAALLLLGKAKLRLVCHERLRVVLYVLGIPITLVSDRDKEAQTRDLSRCHNPEGVLRRTLRRKRREAKKALAKKQRAERKRALRNAKKQQKRDAKRQSDAPKPSITENLSMITALLKRLYRVTNGRLHVRVRKLHVGIGTGDAAKSAILYGVVVQSASYLLAWIDKHLLHVRRDDGAICIEPDYLSDKTRVSIDIVCSIHLSAALGIGIKMLLSYLSQKGKTAKKARARVKARDALQNG